MEEGRSDTCFIKEVNTFEGGFRPLMVNFDQSCLSKEEASLVECGVFMKDFNNENIAVVSKKGQYFTGTTNSDDALCQSLLLIKNKRNNKVRLICTPTCDLSRPVFRDSMGLNTSARNLNNASRQEDIIALKRTFGSKRSMRQSEIGLKMNLNVTDCSELNQTVSNINISQNDIKEVKENDDLVGNILPPCNRSANSVQDVYKLDDLLSSAELSSLESTATFMMENPPTSTDEKNSFFLSKLVNNLGDQLTLQKMELLLYADSLVRFLRTNARELKNKNCPSVICPYSLDIGKKILRDFTIDSSTGRTRPTYIKDKAACYIIVLILLVCNFTLDIEILAACLKGVGQKKIKQLLRTVGAVSMSSSSNKFVLKLPLPSLPTVNQKRGRNK